MVGKSMTNTLASRLSPVERAMFVQRSCRGGPGLDALLPLCSTYVPQKGATMAGWIDGGIATKPCSGLPTRAFEWSFAPARPEGESGEAGRRGWDAPLAGLSGSSMADRFRAWRGASGRRYVFSVFRLEAEPAALDLLPGDADAVVIAAERKPDGTRVLLWMMRTEGNTREFFRGDRVRALASRGNCELHLHLLASDGAERQAVVDDLRAMSGDRRGS